MLRKNRSYDLLFIMGIFSSLNEYRIPFHVKYLFNANALSFIYVYTVDVLKIGKSKAEVLYSY